jgi:hypothetical protein
MRIYKEVAPTALPKSGMRPQRNEKAMKTCQNARKRRYFSRMSIAAEKMAEVLALPEQDRAFLARQLIASLDDTVDADAETQWQEVIDRRSREMAEGRVDDRPEEEVIRDIQAKVSAARHQTS